MIVCIEAVAQPANPGANVRDVKLYAYLRNELPGEGGGDRVSDANHALGIVKKLCGELIREGEPPRGDGYNSLWQVEIQVQDTHRTTSKYRVKYHKENGCPLNAIEYMWAVYGAVKKVFREALNDMRARKEKKHEVGV